MEPVCLISVAREVLEKRKLILGIVYRLNTFPLIHMGFLHMFFNTICLVPLMERFEAEHGTLNTLALFLGRKH